MSNSVEWQIMDYQMWAEAQDWKHDAPRYYANELKLKEIEKIISENSDLSVTGLLIAKLLGYFGDELD